MMDGQPEVDRHGAVRAIRENGGDSQRGGYSLASSVGAGASVGAWTGFLLRDLLPVETASSWVPMVFVGAVLWSTRLRLALTGLAGTCLIVWGLVGFTSITTLLVPLFVRQDPPRSADAVFVLASRLQSEGEPSATAQSRLLRGIELWARGLAPRLLLTDLPPPSPRHDVVAKAAIHRLGLVPAEIQSVGPVRSTREEAVGVGALCRQQGWGRLLVVTSPLHSRRACAALEHEGLDVVCVPSIATDFDLERLYRPVDRFAALRQAVALCVYRFRGWL